MIREATEPAVSLEPIGRESASVLQNLFELYVYDFSEHMPLSIKASGRFEISPGELWWTRDDHFPFFIRHGEALAGFALARAGSRVTDAPEVMDVAEFFVVRGARSKGIGRAAAHALFARFPQRWEARVRETNAAALRFWVRAAETWVGGPATSERFAKDGVDWTVVRLEASQAVQPGQ